MDIKVGNKFLIKGVSFGIEIMGFFPASQNRENVDMFTAILNGETMKINKSFIDSLLALNEQTENKRIEAEKQIEKQKEKEIVKEEVKIEKENITVQKTDRKVGKKNKEK